MTFISYYKVIMPAEQIRHYCNINMYSVYDAPNIQVLYVIYVL